LADQINWEEKGNWICIQDSLSFASDNYADYKEAVFSLCSDSPKDIALDLSNIEYLNSMKIGFLIKVHKILYPVKRKLAVYNCSEKLYQMAIAQNLTEIISFFTLEDELPAN